MVKLRKEISNEIEEFLKVTKIIDDEFGEELNEKRENISKLKLLEYIETSQNNLVTFIERLRFLLFLDEATDPNKDEDDTLLADWLIDCAKDNFMIFTDDDL